MKPTSKIEAEGLRAYEQVQAFLGLQRQQLPLIYCGITLLLVVCGAVTLAMDHPEIAIALLILAVFFPVMAWFKWRSLRERHAQNLVLLAELESTYGEQLPWIQVERHLSALAQLEIDLAEEKKRRAGPPTLSS